MGERGIMMMMLVVEMMTCMIEKCFACERLHLLLRRRRLHVFSTVPGEIDKT